MLSSKLTVIYIPINGYFGSLTSEQVEVLNDKCKSGWQNICKLRNDDITGHKSVVVKISINDKKEAQIVKLSLP